MTHILRPTRPSRVSALARLGRLAAAVLSVLSLAACESRAPLAGAEGSADALGRRVLAALERRDLDDLRRVALREREFRQHVWPDLPAARPERNLPLSYVWGDLHQKSETALASTLAAYGGRRLELVAVRNVGAATQFNTSVVRRQTELTVREAGGGVRQIRVFGSTIEEAGVFKVFSFVVDD